MRRLACPLLAGLLALPAAAQADVPVPVGGDPEMDACTSIGTVSGLDPRGDNFLSVRSAPGGKGAREIARLTGGRQLAICAERGAWLGVVYPDLGRDLSACGISSPRPTASRYLGPCRSGWVHRHYVKIVAG